MPFERVKTALSTSAFPKKFHADQIQKSKILVVGAGGIGCELLKNLALSGFLDIHVVDLDTIDLSNLNRQFLFRRQHISMSKSKVASVAVKKWSPDLKIVSYQSNIITDPQFSLDFFKSFDLVLNALDNLEARRHVNKMCLATNVPLIESGTAGLLGQAKPHIPGVSECFDCVAHETPKTFPVCTIRSTPSNPIHCIVWAKSYLFMQLYGENEDTMSAAEESSEENLEELKKLRVESLALKKLRESVDSPTYVKEIFTKVFDVDVQRLLKNEEMWKIREPPVALSFDKLVAEPAVEDTSGVVEKDHSIWTPRKSLQVFTETALKLGKRLVDGPLEFDKDDVDVIRFVTAAASLRSYNFSITQKTPFEVKQMAGNIIPAIASTNAIIAGLVVLMAFKVLAGKQQDLKNVFLAYSNPARYLHGEAIEAPNKACQVCSTAYRTMKLDLGTRLGEVVQKCRDVFGLEEELSVFRGGSNVIYDADFEDNLESSLTTLGLKDGDFLTIVDESDKPKVPIVLFLKESDTVELVNDKPIGFRYKAPAPVEELAVKSQKRALTDDDVPAESSLKKKAKVEVITLQDNDVMVIE